MGTNAYDVLGRGRSSAASRPLPPMERSIAPHSVFPKRFCATVVRMSTYTHPKTVATYLDLEPVVVSKFLVFTVERQTAEGDLTETLELAEKLGIQAGVTEVGREECRELI